MSQKLILGWLVLLMVMAAFIRVHNTGAFYYNADEAMHTNIASAGSLGKVLEFSRYEIHPPLLYVLLHYWMKISDAPQFVRSLSLLFGLLLIPLYCMIGNFIGGRVSGLACAILITFSHGCIIQSFVVRQYSIFLVFISLALYFYLKWQKNPKTRFLVGYICCGMLAALSHFSAIFTIACIAPFEMARLWHRKADKSSIWPWIFANVTIGIVALYVYHLWQPVFVPLRSYFASLQHLHYSYPALLYPLIVSSYILIGNNVWFASGILLGILVCVIQSRQETYNGISLSSFSRLAVIGFILGELLFISKAYPPLGTRRNLWMLPLLVPAAGDMISLVAVKFAGLLVHSSDRLRKPVAAIMLLTIALLFYDPLEQFHDGSEYVWEQYVWKNFNRYITALGPEDLIITEKDDGIMLKNLYYSLGSDAFTGVTMAKIVPYDNTHILFNPFYSRNYNRAIFLATLQQAQAKHYLDGTNRLIFLRMAWSRSPLTDLMLCEALPKNIMTFPSFLANPPLTRENLLRARAAVMVISKNALISEVLSPHGKARDCLDGKNDMVSDSSSDFIR